MIALYFQGQKSENSDDNGIVIVERITGSTELADALPSAEHLENEIDECSDYRSSREPLTSKSEDLDAPKS